MALFPDDRPARQGRMGPKPPDLSDVKEIRRADLEVFLQDLKAGAEYQRSLLPASPPSVFGYDFGAFFRPAGPLSGDFYDFIPLQGARLAIVIADASGKGIQAALAVMTFRAMLRAQPEPDAPARVALGHVNRMLYRNIKQGMFISAIYCVLDPARNTLDVVNAGHLPLLMWRSKHRRVDTYPPKGPVLGVLSPHAYEEALREETVPLDPGDRLVLITDGVNEAMAPGKKQFGMELLHKRLQTDGDGPTARLLGGISTQIDIHRAGGDQSDDITIVTGRRTR